MSKGVSEEVENLSEEVQRLNSNSNLMVDLLRLIQDLNRSVKYARLLGVDQVQIPSLEKRIHTIETSMVYATDRLVDINMKINKEVTKILDTSRRVEQKIQPILKAAGLLNE